MKYFGWLVGMLLALPAWGTTTTCWDAVAGNLPRLNLGGPVTRYLNSSNGAIAYEGWYYPAGNPNDEYVMHKTVYPNDGGETFTFRVYAAIPQATETNKLMCMSLGAGVLPYFDAAAPRDFATPRPTVDYSITAERNAVSYPINQTIEWDFPGVVPLWQNGYQSVNGTPCTHALCDLQPMWVYVGRVGTTAYPAVCNPNSSTQSVVDAVVTTIICVTR